MKKKKKKCDIDIYMIKKRLNQIDNQSNLLHYYLMQDKNSEFLSKLTNDTIFLI